MSAALNAASSITGLCDSLMKTITLTNNKGELRHFPADATIGDLMQAGATAFRLQPIGSPVEDGWYVDIEACKSKTRKQSKRGSK